MDRIMMRLHFKTGETVTVPSEDVSWTKRYVSVGKNKKFPEWVFDKNCLSAMEFVLESEMLKTLPGLDLLLDKRIEVYDCRNGQPVPELQRQSSVLS